MDAFDLHEQFSINNTTTELSIKDGEGGIPVIHLTNTHCTARISLQGAHLLSWIPNDEKDVIWVSQDAKFAQGKSVRGGVPICWPWFGPHATEANWPAHGFARTSQWNVVEIDVLEDGATRIYFTLNPTHAIKAMWPDGCTVDCIMTIGKRLSFELITHNEGDAPVTIGQAFHTYFNIGDIEKTVILGLDETDYLDKTEGFARKHQIGPVVINDEVDRIYLNTATDCIVEDRGNVREIIIVKTGSHSTVVWNPWKELADKMGDLGEGGYRHMICVETANAAEDVVTIAPGNAHHLWVQYQVQR